MTTRAKLRFRQARKTRATHGKLVRALDELESFYDADDRTKVIDQRESERLWGAILAIQDIESRVYNKAQR